MYFNTFYYNLMYPIDVRGERLIGNRGDSCYIFGRDSSRNVAMTHLIFLREENLGK